MSLFPFSGHAKNYTLSLILIQKGFERMLYNTPMPQIVEKSIKNIFWAVLMFTIGFAGFSIIGVMIIIILLATGNLPAI